MIVVLATLLVFVTKSVLPQTYFQILPMGLAVIIAFVGACLNGEQARRKSWESFATGEIGDCERGSLETLSYE